MHKKNSRFCYSLFGDRTKKKKKKHHRPCHHAVLTYLVLLYLMQRNDGSRQLSWVFCVFVLCVLWVGYGRTAGRQAHKQQCLSVSTLGVCSV